MVAEFTETEKSLLHGQGGSIARKRQCSQKYVRFIILGEREINSALAKNIYADLKALIKVLTPENQLT